MCSPMPDVDPDEIDAPGPCEAYPGRGGDGPGELCLWPACNEPD